MRILLVSTFLLFEGTRFGGSRRILNIALGLGKGHDLRVICMDGNGEYPEWDGFSPGRKSLYLPLDGVLGRAGRLAHPLDARAAVARHRRRLEAFLEEERYDLVILAYSMAPNLLGLRQVSSGRRIVYIEGDLVIGQADAHRRKARGLFRRIRKEIRYRQILRHYRAFLRRVDGFYLSTRTEMAEVESRFPGTRVHQLPMGFEVERITLLPPPDSAATAGFIGNFRHLPNLDALNWYLDRVHPLLASRYPGYSFVVAGMNLPEGLAARADRDSRLILLGAVGDVEAFYARISFLVNPIVSGKGVRTKVIEAAAYGREIISTSLGADGTAPLVVRVADDPDAFAELCDQAMRSGGSRKGIILANRGIVERDFSGEAVQRLLLA